MKKNKILSIVFSLAFILSCTNTSQKMEEPNYMDSLYLDSIKFKFEQTQQAKLDSYSKVFKTIDTLEAIRKDPQQTDSEMTSKVKKNLEKIEYQKKQLDTLLRTHKKR